LYELRQLPPRVRERLGTAFEAACRVGHAIESTVEGAYVLLVGSTAVASFHPGVTAHDADVFVFGASPEQVNYALRGGPPSEGGEPVIRMVDKRPPFEIRRGVFLISGVAYTAGRVIKIDVVVVTDRTRPAEGSGEQEEEDAGPLVNAAELSAFSDAADIPRLGTVASIFLSGAEFYCGLVAVGLSLDGLVWDAVGANEAAFDQTPGFLTAQALPYPPGQQNRDAFVLRLCVLVHGASLWPRAEELELLRQWLRDPTQHFARVTDKVGELLNRLADAQGGADTLARLLEDLGVTDLQWSSNLLAAVHAAVPRII
jgi:hypothetical protein